VKYYKNVSAIILAGGRMSNLKDVAKAANVSMITVSRVINEPDKVKPATKRRIEAVMAGMSYLPNRAARNLASKRTGIIDVYIPESIDLSNPFVMHFIVGISEVLSDKMYSFLIRRSWKKEHSCDGYIVTGLLTNEIVDFYARAKLRNLPVALFGHTDIEQVDYLDVDNILGAEMVVNHLIENKHRRIGMINMDENKDHTRDRYLGYRKALEAGDIPFDPALVSKAPNSVDGGSLAAKTLLKNEVFSALFCASDTLALGAVKAINDAGLRVPDDVSIVGFDGLGHHLLMEPHITTVQQPIMEVGKKLAHIVLARINGAVQRTTGFLAPELIPGRTVTRLC
jgi:LacI family transcriptional regulator